ncbi:MAG: hypothetical protein M0R03_22890 [Novosphingobium sp.]|nr:hypothetical protein [Novosphingobium sp.]
MEYKEYSEKIWNFIDEQLVKESIKNLEYSQKLKTLIEESISRRDMFNYDNDELNAGFHSDVLMCLRELQSELKYFK